MDVKAEVEFEATSTDVRIVRSGMELESRDRRAVCRRCGRRRRDVFRESRACSEISGGRECICRVIWMRVRGIWRVRIMVLRVLWRRVSRWRSLGPGLWELALCGRD